MKGICDRKGSDIHGTKDYVFNFSFTWFISLIFNKRTGMVAKVCRCGHNPKIRKGGG